MLQDLHIAFRSLWKRPGFTLVATTTLALGIGAVTTVYSLGQAILLQPLPFADPERLTVVYDVQPSLDRAPMSYPEFVDWRGQERIFSAVGSFLYANYNFTGDGDPELLPALRTSANLLPVLGREAQLGRGFSPDEEAPSAPRVTMLSDGFWRRRFGADPRVIGRDLTLDGEPWTVIGVLPPDFEIGDSKADLWLPLRLDPTRAPRGLHFLAVLGRLRPGLDLETARAEADAAADRFAEAAESDHGVFLAPLPGELVAETAPLFLLLGAAAGCVLLIACVNVANVLLARSVERGREMAIRKSLGGGRRRLIRQLLTESAVLALAGGLAGLLLAWWGVGALLATAVGELPRAADTSIDPGVLAFALGLSLLTSLLFGSVPALRAAGVPPMAALRGGGPERGGRRRNRLAPALVVTEVALSLVLLAGAGLLIRSLLAALDTDPGFRPEGVIALDLSLPDARYPDAAAHSAFFARLRERVERLPGVEASAETSALPLAGGSPNGSFQIEGREWPEGERPLTDKRLAGPGYFATLGIPVVRGREFDDRDRAGAAPVALINETLARRFFPGEDPVGRRIDFDWHTDGWQEIVGVVGDVRHRGLDLPPVAELYLPYEQSPEVATRLGRSLVIRASGAPETLMPSIRQQVFAVDSDQPVAAIRTLDRMAADSLSQRSTVAGLLGALGAAALILAAVGLYGVLSCIVHQRSHEIGVRMAVGARHGDILSRVIGRGMALAIAGAAVGLAAALAATRLLGSLLYGVNAGDPLTFLAAGATLLFAALVACAVPARAAARVDPIRALRAD